MVTQTSRKSYYGHVVDGKARTQRERIYQLLLGSPTPLNRRQISKMLFMPINAVTGRVNALLTSDMIQVAYVDEDPVTGKRVEFLEVAWPQEQGRMF